MSIDFQPFDQHKQVRIYRRNLPHWRQDAATYFVTFCLHDSLPQHVLKQLEQLRRVLSVVSESDGDVNKVDREYFRKLEHYLDAGSGGCCLRDPQVALLVENSMRHFEGSRYQLGELVVMPNHVHVLVRPLGTHELDQVLHAWKSFTAKTINMYLHRSGRVWRDESHDRIVRDEQELCRVERYIRNNGVSSQRREVGW